MKTEKLRFTPMEFTEPMIRADIIHDLTTEASRGINSEKEKLIKERIKSLTGEDIDIIAEVKRLFPRICRILKDNSELFFWNDGSENGKLLITFYPLKEHIDPYTEIGTVKINIGFNYK